jgi:hypothetical protein
MITNFTATVIATLRPRLLLWRLLIAAEVTSLIGRVVVAEARHFVDDRRHPGLLRRVPAVAPLAGRHRTVEPRESIVRLPFAALLLAITLAGVAHAAPRGAPPIARASGASMPTYNVEAACRALAAVPEAQIFETSGPNSTEHCVESENRAREQLVKEWSDFKAADRTMCVGVSSQGEVDPVYTELISCLEMARDNSGSDTSTSRAQGATDAHAFLR